jgi:hypothetical protein
MHEELQVFAAGRFGDWLERMRCSLWGDGGMDVPCGDCTGCCISGYSLQVRPTDVAARARIPPELLASSPGFGAGELTLPARPDGTCQMLRAGRCSIYADRPLTCLDYDCRVFAAAGIDAGGPDKAAINQRVRAWRFSYANDDERRTHDAVRATARFIREHPQAFAALGMPVPRGPMGIAVLAVKGFAAFKGAADSTSDEVALARAVVEASKRDPRSPR